MTPDPKQTEVLAASQAPLALAMPEPITLIKEPNAVTAMIPLKEETRSAATAQADQFIQDLLHMDVTSGDFRAAWTAPSGWAGKRSATARCSPANSWRKVSWATPTIRLSR